MAINDAEKINISGTYVRNLAGAKIVDGKEVEGGYFVCDSLPTWGTPGQLCYCTANSSFYQYDDSGWIPKEFSGLRNGTNIDGTSKAYLEYDDTLQAIKFVFN